MVQFIEAWLGLYAEQDRDEETSHAGQGLVEYALLLVLIAIAAIAILSALGQNISVLYSASNVMVGIP